MKIYVYPVLLLIICSLFIACKKDMEYADNFHTSERVWSNFKASAGNSYSYMVTTGSWTGTVTETVLTVRNGQVVARSYVHKEREGTGPQLVVLAQWEENNTDLGSHQEGAKPFTLDDIYAQAKSDWLKKRGDAKTYFETLNGGMISLCGYVPDGCADDCFRGITIGYIRKL
ncbi:hypothetical protein [Chitinophaga agri]|uniref:Uncharacterized protein n=1 Tax=Chitinophaga agri TaxID=2703787 RepID=A0A6B9ZIG9_9BACT|nr:hypothetical protein [Chitinophaga agri]QHS62242.1 hypothetical protein GWR21_22325 [Chitinophaga agri]